MLYLAMFFHVQVILNESKSSETKDALYDNFLLIQVVLNENQKNQNQTKIKSESKDVEKMEMKQRVRRCILV